MHILCPHCRNPIEIVKLDPRAEIPCPSCGSSFRVETESTVSWKPDGGKKLGKFEILEQVGSGAFGTVFKARDPELDRFVAIKVPRAGNLPEPQDLDRFLREARSVAQLRFPSIITIHEVGADNGTPYLVSDFVEGVTLADLITGRRPTFHESAKLLAEVADALQYAHSLGVVHRDVKPSNIMIRPDGSPCVMDFGLAKRDAGEITMTIDGQILGTPAYMSPEQARGEGHKVDGRSDVYSLGVILYQLLTGELPFRGNKAMLLHQVLHEEPRGPRTLNDKIPRDLETIALKAMAKEPGRRYGSAKEMAEDLRRWLSGEPILARPVGRVERGMKWMRRNPAIGALVMVSVVALFGVVAAVVGTLYSSRLQAALDESVEQKKIADAQRQIADVEKAEADKQKTLVKYILYSSRMGMAQRAWQEARIDRLEQLLEEQRPLQPDQADLRGFEWYYQSRLLRNSSLFTLQAHASYVTCVAFSPDGTRIASASHDHTAKIWDVDSGRHILTVKSNAGPVMSVVFSPDGTRLATASGQGWRKTGQGELKIWDAKTGQELFSFVGHTGVVTSAAFSPDGKHLLSGSDDQTIRLWEVVTRRPVLSIKHDIGYIGAIRVVAFSPDGKFIAGGVGGRAKLWDPITGEELRSFDAGSVYVKSIAFTSDGKRFATAGDVSDRVRIWDVQENRKVLSLPKHRHSDWVASVAFSPDDKRLATASWDRTVRVWDATNLDEIQCYKGHTSQVYCVAFNQDGKRLASGSYDKTVRIWDTTVAQEVLRCESKHKNDLLYSISFSPDSKRIAVASTLYDVAILNAVTGEWSLTLDTQGSHTVAFSPDGKRLATERGIWEVGGRQVFTLKERPNSIAFSPNDKFLACGYGEYGKKGGDVRVFGVATGKEEATCRGHAWQINSVAFSPDSQRIASGSDDRTIRIWDVKSGQEAVRLRGHDSSVLGVVFSPDGKRVASASADTTVRVWDATSGKLALTLRGHTNTAYSVAFSPDGKRLASSADDDTVKIWDAWSGEEILSLASGSLGRSVAFSPDGNRLAVGMLRGSVLIWAAASKE